VSPRLALRRLPLRVKVMLTLMGAAVVLLGLATHLSFTYWKAEAVAAAEQQALLAAASARTAVESGLQAGRTENARRALQQLRAHEPVVGVRVYARDGTVMISPDEGEEGRRRPGVWMPSRLDIGRDGVARADAGGDMVRAFVPIAVPPAAVLEVEYSLGPVRRAMDRGARLGLGLVIGTFFALAAIVLTMLEREVVAPLTRMADLMGSDGRGPASTDEMGRLAAGVAVLLEKESQASAERDRLMQQAGFAQVGELAAEMAHAFKRPLASIQSAIQLLSQE
jgi:signal transduction histidine kinase